MLAVLGTAVQENYHPLWGFNEKEMDGAIFHFQEIQNVYPLFWTALLFIIGVVEAKTIATGWDENMGGSVSTFAFPPSLPHLLLDCFFLSLFTCLGWRLPFPYTTTHPFLPPSLPPSSSSLPKTDRHRRREGGLHLRQSGPGPPQDNRERRRGDLPLLP